MRGITLAKCALAARATTSDNGLEIDYMRSFSVKERLVIT